MINTTDLIHLMRAVDLAEEALQRGDEPFGSLLVDKAGNVLKEDRNQVSNGDQTEHPEFNLAKWAAKNMSAEDRKTATVYTSGEHCAMCAAAHAWVGLGRIVYASSTEQLVAWMKEFEAPPSPIYAHPIQDIARNIEVDGPVPELAARIKELQRQAVARRKSQ